MQKAFAKEGFQGRLGPIPFLSLALLSQTGMSFVQQGLVILGTFFMQVYHLDLAELGLITSAMSLGVMMSMTMVGVGVDRLGPRVVLFWGALSMAGLSLLLTRVSGFGMLLGILFFLGITLAAAPSAGTKAVFTAFVDRPRGLVMGIRQTGVPFGAAIGAWFLPRMVPHFGLNSVYVIFAIELLVTGWAFSAAMRARGPAVASGTRVRLSKADWSKLFQPALVAFLMVSGQYILLTYSITELHRAHHLTLVLAGEALALSQIGGGVGRIVLGQVSDRLGGRRAPVIVFAGVLGAVLALTVAFLPQQAPIWSVLCIWFFFGFGATGWNALALTWAGESVPPSHSGLAMGLTGSIVFLGSSVFPPLFGVVVDLSHRLAYGWILLAVILSIAATTANRASRRSKVEHGESGTTAP